MTDTTHRDHRSEREILLDLSKKVTHMSAAIDALTASVATLEADETAAATEFAALATQIGELKAGSITEAEVNALAEKVTAVGTALSTATAGA
jgi:hypothetical protein